MNIDDLERTLTESSLRSQVWKVVRRSVEARGHWKAKDRGISGKELERKRKLRHLDTHLQNTQQVRLPQQYDDSTFSEGI